ncbi:MAG TPA: TetR/AcrR family transcriptional regulator [Atribacteraceae bacterium]|nr:TetR/AcrR family transcriptional regulator [Atribacteraceae bacterium]
MKKNTAFTGEKHLDDKRTMILGAAKKVFSEKSYFEATLENISDVSGVKKSTIYYYFRSKFELLVNILETTIHEAEENFHTIDCSRDDKKAVLADIIEAHCRFMEEKKDVILIIQRAGFDFLHHLEVKKRIDQILEKMKKLRWEVGQRIGPLQTLSGKRVSGEQVLRLILPSLAGYYIEEIKENRLLSPDVRTLFQEIFTAFLR